MSLRALIHVPLGAPVVSRMKSKNWKSQYDPVSAVSPQMRLVLATLLLFFHFSFLFVAATPRLLVCNALCGSSTRTRKRRRPAGGAAVSGAVEADLE